MVLWLLLGTFSMVAMLWTAAHKTVVISARSQEQGELVPEYRTEQTGEMQKTIQTEQIADRKGSCEAQNEGVLLRLSMREVLEYHSTLEEGYLWVDYVSPKELYDRIVVLDPVGGGRDLGVTASGCQEKEVALSVARQTAQLMEDRQVKVYLTRTEDIDVTKEARRQFADWVGADLYLEIGLSSDPENTSAYGISGEYNDEYYIPEFGNLQWADCVTRQVTVAASNRAVGLFPATEEDVLWEIAIPSARISLGYVTNTAERQLLIQEDYQKKLAQGIAEAINEVYTNTQ